jgi:hypothetical protein
VRVKLSGVGWEGRRRGRDNSNVNDRRQTGKDGGWYGGNYRGVLASENCRGSVTRRRGLFALPRGFAPIPPRQTECTFGRPSPQLGPNGSLATAAHLRTRLSCRQFQSFINTRREREREREKEPPLQSRQELQPPKGLELHNGKPPDGMSHQPCSVRGHHDDPKSGRAHALDYKSLAIHAVGYQFAS